MEYNNNMEIKLGIIRYDKKITLNELSKLSGIPRSTLYDIECSRKSPRLDHLEKIAIALDIKVTDLFDSDYK